MKELTKDFILQLLMTNDKAVVRALIALKKYQTVEEQCTKTVVERNNAGFTKADASIGMSMADFAETKGYLSEKQIAFWRKIQPSGRCRICKYAAQLLRIAKEKSKQ